MFEDELKEMLADITTVAVPFGGPLPPPNAYICLVNGVLEIYPTTGGWLGASAATLVPDLGPWAD